MSPHVAKGHGLSKPRNIPYHIHYVIHFFHSRRVPQNHFVASFKSRDQSGRSREHQNPPELRSRPPEKGSLLNTHQPAKEAERTGAPRPSRALATMSSSKELVNLAKSLPAQLQRFLARYPPPSIIPPTANGAEPPKTAYQLERPNPFRFWKHPETGKWHDPVYSLRRQAELVKMAKEHGVEGLLPESTKSSEYRLARRVEFGLRVKGTGVGQRVKGHAYERQILQKYVGLFVLAEKALVWNGLLTLFVQDAEEERGHVTDAQAHQGVEEGR